MNSADIMKLNKAIENLSLLEHIKLTKTFSKALKAKEKLERLSGFSCSMRTWIHFLARDTLAYRNSTPKCNGKKT
jgi:hypothetical protein